MFLKYLVWGQTRCEILYDPLRIGLACGSGDSLYQPSELSLTYYHNRLVSILLPEQSPYPISSYVYVIKSVAGAYAGAYKIGLTHADIYKRTAQSQSYYGCVISRVWAIALPGHGANVLEPTLHYHFRDKLIRHEWHNLSDQDLNDIRSLPGGFDISHSQTYSYHKWLKQQTGAA